MNSLSSNILNPNNLLIDDRSFSDLILFISKLSDQIAFYNSKNKLDGTFSALLNSNEVFLLAEISKYPISKINNKRLQIVKKFDDSIEENFKKNMLNSYVELTNSMFFKINDWFLRSRKNTHSKSTGSIENYIENVIDFNINEIFNNYIFLQKKFNDLNIIDKKYLIDIKNFNSIVWKPKNLPKINFEKSESSITTISNALKQVVLISNKLYENIYKITIRSEKSIEKSLTSNSSNNAHIGLLFTFLELFKNLQIDINKVTKKHLDYYFKNILKQSKLDLEKIKTFINIEIDENINKLILGDDNLIIAGQYDDGENIFFKMNDSISLNNAKISSLMTIYTSRNKMFEYKSSFRLISSVFSKYIAKNNGEVEAFNENEKTFSTFGKDQNLLTYDERTMENADIGFIISSPILKLSESDRKIAIDFYFEIDSMKRLSDLIIDISNLSDFNEEEIFYRIFSDGFEIEYTTDLGWESIDNYEFNMPTDWTDAKLSLEIKLDKLKPSFHNYNIDLHNLKVDTENPVIKVNLRQNQFYNSFSFLNKMILNKIDINVYCESLKKMNVFRDGELISIDSDFEIFGPTAKQKSKLFIACEELFNKKIQNFEIKWDFTNLNEIEYDLKKNYELYNYNIRNDSFKIKLSALSDFNYFNHSDKDLIFNLFNFKKNLLEDEKIIKVEKMSSLKVNPNYSLNSGEINDFSNDLQTGIIRIELIEPKIGFGFDQYPKIYAKQIANNTDKKIENTEPINEPFSPKISNISINYNAKTSMIFKESDRIENDYDENNSFFLISPTGIEKTFSKESVKNSIVYDLASEGELIIGFENSESIENLNLLFEIKKNENTDYQFSKKVEWYYSSFETWKKLDTENILSDGTTNLVKTGILCLKLPTDFSDQNIFLDDNKFYIKAVSKDKADQFGLIKSIRTNAVSISEIKSKKIDNKVEQLKENSVEGFENRVDGVISVNQPIGSPKIKLVESDMEFYRRISQLLRHKKRPVNKVDIEIFLLDKFNWLSHVKCYNNNSNSIKILCLKKIERDDNIEEVKLSAAEISDVKNYLKNYTSPFINFDITSPIFEDLWIKCKIIFSNNSAGNNIERLNKDLLDFICPWKNIDSNKKIITKLKKINIVNFIKGREYVKFITGFSIIHLKKFEDGSIEAYDSARSSDESDFIESGSERSIIVPRDNSLIHVISKKEYFPPEAIKSEELKINYSFLVEKKQQQNQKKFKLNENKNLSKDQLQFIMKI